MAVSSIIGSPQHFARTRCNLPFTKELRGSRKLLSSASGIKRFLLWWQSYLVWELWLPQNKKLFTPETLLRSSRDPRKCCFVQLKMVTMSIKLNFSTSDMVFLDECDTIQIHLKGQKHISFAGTCRIGLSPRTWGKTELYVEKQNTLRTKDMTTRKVATYCFYLFTEPFNRSSIFSLIRKTSMKLHIIFGSRIPQTKKFFIRRVENKLLSKLLNRAHISHITGALVFKWPFFKYRGMMSRHGGATKFRGQSSWNPYLNSYALSSRRILFTIE